MYMQYHHHADKAVLFLQIIKRGSFCHMFHQRCQRYLPHNSQMFRIICQHLHYLGAIIIHVKLLDFQGGRISPFIPLRGGGGWKLQICYIFSSFRSINNNKSVDKAFVYLLSTMITVCDNCWSCRFWSFWAYRYRFIGFGQAIIAEK